MGKQQVAVRPVSNSLQYPGGRRALDRADLRTSAGVLSAEAGISRGSPSGCDDIAAPSGSVEPVECGGNFSFGRSTVHSALIISS